MIILNPTSKECDHVRITWLLSGCCAEFELAQSYIQRFHLDLYKLVKP